MTETGSKPVILAVDDTPENLDVVKGILADDYVVKVAINGPIALKIAEKSPPDLVLLDIMMPGMDGYEVCRRLKSREATRDVPVIFLTAMDKTQDEAQGFSLGAADYINKPVNPPILEARVKTHLALKESMDRLQDAYAVIKRQKDRMEEELNIGRDIQMSMLPLAFPAYPERDEFTIHALLKPAREVGGDFYDFFFINDDELCFVVGDVSGKGVPAALFMAVTKTMIKARAMDDPSPASIVTRVNDELSADNPSMMFVTLFLAICNVSTGECRYTNAGHNPPWLLKRDGGGEALDQRHGPIIGAMGGLAFGESRIQLGNGDRLLLFTDGVTEAMDPAGELYTESRLEQGLEGQAAEPAETLVNHVLERVETFAGPADQADDITLLAFSLDREPEGGGQGRMSMAIEADLGEIRRLNDALADFAGEHGVPAAAVQKMGIAVDDLVNNIISYGVGEGDDRNIEVACRRSDGRLEIEVSDGGMPFNPFSDISVDTSASLEERQVGGLGRLLVRELMDEVDYRRVKGRNIVKMTLFA